MRRCWNGVNAGLVSWSNVPILVLLFRESEAAAASAEHHPDCASLFKRQIIGRVVRIGEGFARCCQRQWNSAWNVFSIFRIEFCLPIEGLDLRRDFYCSIRNV